ncbi:MAG: hypothetical protein QM657_03340 [Lacrimispora sp.]
MEEKIKAGCICEGDVVRYFDRNGDELHDGDVIEYASGRTEVLYLTDKGELGTDATNPEWIRTGRAEPGEYGLYPLTVAELREIALKEPKIKAEQKTESSLGWCGHET